MYGASAGFTLAELLVVAIIMATLAGVAIHAAGNATAQAAQTATRAQLASLRQAVLGVADGTGIACYRRDCRAMPAYVADLLAKPAAIAPFDPSTGFGWRGPYVFVPRATYEVDVARGFTPRYVRPPQTANDVSGLLAVLDGWGNAIVLQIPDADGDPATRAAPDELLHMRLVSAGENGILDTPPDPLYPAIGPGHDDVVVYLQVADLR